jgi:hypothetical protein
MKNYSKLSLVALVAGSFLGLSPVARALIPAELYTYVFTADPGYTTAFNGSTITIEDKLGDYSLVDWDLFDGASVLTQANSSQTSVFFSADPSAFIGTFSVDDPAWLFLSSTGPLSYYEEAEYEGSDSMLDSSYTTNTVLSVAIDPPGGWAGSGSGVPDAANTFGLLLAGAGAMGIIRRRMAAGLPGRR